MSKIESRPLLERFLVVAGQTPSHTLSRRNIPCKDEIDKLDDASLRSFVLQANAAASEIRPQVNRRSFNYTDPKGNQIDAIEVLVAYVAPRAKNWTPDEVESLISGICRTEGGMYNDEPARALTTIAERLPAASHTRPIIAFFGRELTRLEHRTHKPDYAWIKRLQALLGSIAALPISRGEAWSDAASDDISALSAKSQADWVALLNYCLTATSSTPSAKWLKTAAALVKPIGAAALQDSLARWLPLVDLPRTEPLRGEEPDAPSNHRIIEPHMNILRGLCWLGPTLATPSNSADLARMFRALAASCYRKVPQVGPRAVKVGHAALYALGAIPGRDALGQLAMLKVKVKFIPAQKAVDKALNAAAEREGLPRDEIEELAVPTYGLSEVGLMEEPMGDFTARLTVSGVGDSELVFIKADGKIVKSVPAAVKASHAEELKDLKSAAKDISTMLPAQKDRIDGLYLEQKSWAMPTWRERYLDHPLTGILARRLIWLVAEKSDGPWHAVTWLAGNLVDAAGVVQSFDESAALVRLWHPMDSDAAAVLAWRRYFEDRHVQQPFKQAHREVYLLTDAERATGIYSNRYAAHVLRQHQFHALCAARGWRNQLRLLVDAEYNAPRRVLRAYGLRAEFWVEGAGRDYGIDTNDSGAFLHLTTDQVRFYRAESTALRAHAGGGGYGLATFANPNPPALATPAAANDPNTPVRLEAIPPLVFSEIMRDIDLFVGVGSVGNNPNWQDGGPEHRYRDYWWTFGFGELSGTAESRRELLTRLLPRLRIASRCELADRFLRVTGKLRTYKIHLGSGNILMEPNDRYLCIVPSGREELTSAIHLPFDGDRTLSLILSKAFLLADDGRITDPKITSQIAGD